MTNLYAVGFVLQENPPIYQCAISGKWLLEHSTTSWRLKDPEKGFQRIVKVERAKEIAVNVLDQQKTFPNSIVLATDQQSFSLQNGEVVIPSNSKFLVVDGQHRLYAQKFSSFIATYSCTIHCGLDEVQMARLFLQINDTQKRVPSSLRWDLVRLVRPDDDPYAIAASDIILELATTKTSPLYQRIDLTGEQNQIPLKQGSLGPEMKALASPRSGPLKNISYQDLYDLLERYLAAMRAIDSQLWRDGNSVFLKQNRVMRVMLRLIPDILINAKMAADKITGDIFKEYLEKVDQNSIEPENIKSKQGHAGINDIYKLIHKQMFKK